MFGGKFEFENRTGETLSIQLEPECQRGSVAPGETIQIACGQGKIPPTVQLYTAPVQLAIWPGDAEVLVTKNGANLFETDE